MRFVIEDENFLYNEEKNYIKETILKYTSFTFQQKIGEDEDTPLMLHSLVERIERADPNLPNRACSPHTEFFLKLLLRFTTQYQLEFNRVLRGMINCTSKIKRNNNKSTIHIDHTFPHSQFLLYLGEEVHGDLMLYENDEKTLIKKIKPKPFKIVCFGNDVVPHQFEYPNYGLRIAVVMTFD